MTSVLEEYITNRFKEILTSHNIPISIQDRITENINLKLFYTYIVKRLKEKSYVEEDKNVLSRKTARKTLARGYNIPLKLQVKVLNELESNGMIERKSKRSIIIK